MGEGREVCEECSEESIMMMDFDAMYSCTYMLSCEFKCYKNITDQWSIMEGEMQIVECGSHYETNANSNGKKMINGQAPTPSFTGIKSIPYPRRPSRSRHDIEFFLAISNSAHEVGFGDSLASRLTLAEGREKFDEIYLRACAWWWS